MPTALSGWGVISELIEVVFMPVYNVGHAGPKRTTMNSVL